MLMKKSLINEEPTMENASANELMNFRFQIFERVSPCCNFLLNYSYHLYIRKHFFSLYANFDGAKRLLINRAINPTTFHRFMVNAKLILYVFLEVAWLSS